MDIYNCLLSISFHSYSRSIMTTHQNPTKVELRKRIQGILRSMTEEQRIEQSNAITNKVLALPEYKTAQRVSIYLSTDGEVSTLDILKDMFESNKTVFSD